MIHDIFLQFHVEIRRSMLYNSRRLKPPKLMYIYIYRSINKSMIFLYVYYIYIYAFVSYLDEDIAFLKGSFEQREGRLQMPGLATSEDLLASL